MVVVFFAKTWRGGSCVSPTRGVMVVGGFQQGSLVVVVCVPSCVLLLKKSDVMVMFSATEMMVVMFVCPRCCPPSGAEHT